MEKQTGRRVTLGKLNEFFVIFCIVWIYSYHDMVPQVKKS